MGAMKDLMIDMMNSDWEQNYVSETSFICPKCEEFVQTEVHVPEPCFAAEKAGDMTGEGEVEVECNHCGKVFCGYVYAGPFECDITLTEYPGTEVESEAPHYENYTLDEYFVPESPLEVFKNTFGELREFLDKHCYEESTNLLNRMVFSQAVAAFEAYFCDTLIKTITQSANLMERAVTHDKALLAIKPTLKEIIETPDIVKRSIENSLKNRLYHDIDKVLQYYSKILDITIYPDKDSIQSMKDVVLYRHDCVHRNGKDKNDTPLSHITKSYVSGVLDLIESFVDTTQAQIDALDDT